MEHRSSSIRSHSIIDALQAYNQPLSASDKGAKYGKMSRSPFRFYRGTNHIFWADFANDERLQSFSHHQTATWIQGDLHTENYGAYHNDDGDIIYDLNDFDEAVVADYQFDLWRMAISIVLVARQPEVCCTNQRLRLGDEDSATLVDTFVEAYLDTLTSYRGNRNETKVVFTAKALPETLENLVDSAKEHNTRQRFLDEWTLDGSSQASAARSFKILEKPTKLQPVSPEEWEAIAQQFPQYGQTLTGKLSYDEARFQILDIAKRINAGTGSLGVPRYYVLIAGDKQQSGQAKILDLKRQGQPITYDYMKEGDRHIYDQQFGTNHALRHAIAYRALTNHTDDYLGWIKLDLPSSGDGHGDRYFSVRELSPYQKAFKPETLTNIKDFKEVATTWGTILATAHARSDKNFDSTFIPYSFDKKIDQLTDGHHKEFRQVVRTIAFEYADQVHADWTTFINSSLIK